MINFREMVLEAITAKDTLSNLSLMPTGGLGDVFAAITSKFPSFALVLPEIKKSTFHAIAWNNVGTRPTVSMFVNNEIYQEAYPYLDFLCLIRDDASLKACDWGTHSFVASQLAPIESTFIGRINLMPGSDSPLFGYTPASTNLLTRHKQIKEKILSDGLVGKKTIKNCEKKQYTVRQAIYLATQLRQRNMPIVATIPANNKAIDDFLIQAVVDENAYLGGAVNPKDSSTTGIKAAVKNKLSAIFRPKTIPAAVKDMVEVLLSFMDSVRSHAVITESLVFADPDSLTALETETLKKSVNKVLNTKVAIIVALVNPEGKEITAKLISLLNHVPGEKDWVGKIQSAAAGMKSLESALGGAKM